MKRLLLSAAAAAAYAVLAYGWTTLAQALAIHDRLTMVPLVAAVAAYAQWRGR